MTRTVAYFIDGRELGGLEQVLLHLLAGLDRRRWRPVLFHHDAPGLAPLGDAARELGVALRPVPPIREPGDLVRLPHLVRAIRAERPALFHAHLNWPLSCRFGLVAARLARVPAVVATVHCFPELRITRSMTLQHRVVTRCVDRFLAVSDHIAGRLRRHFSIPDRRLGVVPNGISLAPFTRPAASAPDAVRGAGGAPVVLTAARLSRGKGHRFLLEAAAELPGVVFVLAGDGPEREPLEAQARALGIADRVHFAGYHDDVPGLLAGSDLFVLPSLYEGLPLSVLEAMAAGTPVVATAIGGTDEAVVHGETGLLVPRESPGELAGAIRECLSDRALSARLAAAGRARVRERFSSEVMVQRVAQVYDELLARHPSGAAARLSAAGAGAE